MEVLDGMAQEKSKIRVHLADRLELWSIDKVRPYAGNSRTHDAAQVEDIAASMRRFGFTAPLLVDATAGVLIAGHGRLLAAQLLGLESVPVLVVDHLTDAERRALTIADNKLAERGGWDAGQLAAELQHLRGLDFKLELLGFQAAELDQLMAGLDMPDLGAAGEAPPELDGDPGPSSTGSNPAPREGPPPNMPTTAVSRPGDIWQLGQHRITCADCKDPKAVGALFAGVTVPLVMADPPYCSGGFQEASKKAGTWGDIAADNLSSRGYSALMAGMLQAARPQACYLFTDWRMWQHLGDQVEAAGLAVRAMIVWDKGWPSLGQLWRAQHELVMFGSRDGLKRKPGSPGAGNVVQANRTRNENHYTEKPVDLLAKLLAADEASPREACPVFDPFMGSGSTLLACEERNRPGFGMDVEPKFVDVAALRWQESTGQVATLEATGQTFADVSAERVGAGDA